MVNMVGFHHREPEYNTATPGEPGYFVKIRTTPTAQYPLCARVHTPTGGIIFHTPEEAAEWLDTPHRHMAETYIKWTKENNELGSGWDSHCGGIACSVTHFSSCNTSPSI